MKEIDELMKSQFVTDLQNYASVVRGMQMETIPAEVGIFQAHGLVDTLVSDMLILDQGIHDDFVATRNKISQNNIEAKEARRLGFKPAKDSLDQRQIDLLILTQYDLKKHVLILELVKSIASEAGWLR